MIKQLLTTVMCWFLLCGTAMAQGVNYTAKDLSVPYQGVFRPGVNMGYYPPYNDADLANIAAGNSSLNLEGVGIKTARPALFDWFTTQYGLDSRLDIYDHFESVGLEDLTCIVGFPADSHRDQTSYCTTSNVESEMFDNLYTDIWDGGANGTPYNDENYYAAYLYEVVSRYGSKIKFWEIWNEPGFDYTGNTGWRAPGDPVGNWWDFNPNPCDYKLRAPIYHYVRTLRISWEIIKSLYPESYVCVAGVGFPAFLDSVLRNTDNPDDGSVTNEYPHGGGAYFDVMGFHSYPDIDGSVRYWNSAIGGFSYTRHSDAAALGIEIRKGEYQDVLNNYGYDGVTYPEKQWIITEINIPRRAFSATSIGNQEAQMNYIIKAYVKAMENDILQMHVFNLIDSELSSNATDEFDLLGLYTNIENTAPYGSLEMNPEGRAYKTASNILFGTTYDKGRTVALNLPNDIDGGAFLDPATGLYTYVLWAKTTIDISEVANATYSFAPNWNLTNVDKREWDFSGTDVTTSISAQNIALTGRPIFLSETQVTTTPLTATFTSTNTTGCAPFSVQYTDQSVPNVDSWLWTFEGGTPATSTSANPLVVYNNSGAYTVTLEVTDPSGGTNSFTQSAMVLVDEKPTADFDVNQTITTEVNFAHNAGNYDDLEWDFGDGNSSTDSNPTHEYAADGTYTVVLEASNQCGSTTYTEEIVVQTVVAPQAGFTSDVQSGCDMLTVQFTDMSTNMPDSWEWTFTGGTPATSTDQNPTVTYSTPGIYTVILQPSNAAGTDVSVQTSYIVVEATPVASFMSNVVASTATFTNFSTSATTYLWDFGDGNTNTTANPSHVYAMDGTYTVVLEATNQCGTTSFTQTVVVQNIMVPQAAFTTSVQAGCDMLTVQFTDMSTNSPDSWDWIFTGGTPATSTDQNPVVTYSTPGTYSVILQTTNAAGTDLLVQTDYIVVGSSPVANFTSSISGSTVSFSNFSTSATSYLWDFGDGNTSTMMNPSHAYSGDDSYLVTLTATNSCGTTTVTNIVNIQTLQAPVANFVADTLSGCNPLTVQFLDQSTNAPDSWLWSFSGGSPSTSTDQNPVVTFNNPGTNTVVLQAGNQIGNDSKISVDYITVSASPVANFVYAMNGQNVDFTNLSQNGTSYSWDFGDGTISTDTNPSHMFGQDGTYDVTLTVTNSCGSITMTEQIVVSGVTLPQAMFVADNNVGCAPFTVQFTDQSTNNPVSWAWLFPGGTPSMSTDQNPIVTYNSVGQYAVSLSVGNSSGTNLQTEDLFITVHDDPVADFSAVVIADSVIFTNNTTGGGTLIWDFGDGTTSNEFSPIHEYAAAGIYNVTLSVSNACGFDAYQTQIQVGNSTSVDELNQISNFQLFPNPNNGQFTMILDGEGVDNLEARIYNILGQTVHTEQLDFNLGHLNKTFDMSHLANGTYFIQLSADDKVLTKKLVKH